MGSALVSDRGAVGRRDVLIGAGRGALGLALAALTVTACGSEPPPDVTDLRAQLALAYNDSELARAAVPAAPRALVPALTQVAGERARHAQAIADEISRTLGTFVPATAEVTSSPAPPTGQQGATTTPAPPPTAAEVVAALRTAADRAAESAAQESGYRAGLLGSVAASCTAAYTVALAAAGPTT
ncbi:MAG: hypothetical protein ABWY45_20410 [Mycobacterium sp.]